MRVFFEFDSRFVTVSIVLIDFSNDSNGLSGAVVCQVYFRPQAISFWSCKRSRHSRLPRILTRIRWSEYELHIRCLAIPFKSPDIKILCYDFGQRPLSWCQYGSLTIATSMVFSRIIRESRSCARWQWLRLICITSSTTCAAVCNVLKVLTFLAFAQKGISISSKALLILPSAPHLLHDFDRHLDRCTPRQCDWSPGI